MNTDRRLDSSPVHQIAVILDHRYEDGDTLARAAALARHKKSEVRILFVEDENLLRLADLPCVHEIDRATGMISDFDQTILARRNARQVARLGRLISKSISARQFVGGVKVVRGQLVEQAIAASGQADVVFMSMQHQAAAISAQRLPGLEHVRGQNMVPTRMQRKSVAVVFDGSQAADRALQVASELSAATESDLVVAFRSTEAGLREQCARSLADFDSPVRYVDQTIADAKAVRGLVRRIRCAALILPVDSSLMTEQTGTGLMEVFNCPLVLIR